jgi:drug/metabolite transporter (DMT)-like permease
VPIDLGHFAHRFIEPFNSESRFYWPAVIALGIALVANIVWYYLPIRGVSPAEHTARPWAFWINVITLIVVCVLFIAKAPFLLATVAFALDLAALAYLYVAYVPPLEVAWMRERRRAKYLPKPKRRRR